MGDSGLVQPGRAVGANEKFKQRSGAWFWKALALATLIHYPVLAYWPAFEASGSYSTVAGPLPVSVLKLLPEIEAPLPPPPIPRPALPVVSTSIAFPDEITIQPVTFESAVPMFQLSAPPAAAAPSTEELARAPVYTPYSVAPRLLNREEVLDELTFRYERLGRITGRVVVWFFIDEEGVVRNTVIKEPARYDALNEAALEVADIMRFSPALDRSERVPAWVALPITFVQR